MSTNLLSSLYEHLGELGAGTYGIVTKARSKKVKNRLVALKRIMVKAQDARNNNGINFTALREIRVLRDMNHANVIKLYDVHRKNICFCPSGVRPTILEKYFF